MGKTHVLRSLDAYSRAVGLAALLLLVTAEAIGEAEHDRAIDTAEVVVVAPLRLISGTGYRRGALEEIVYVQADQQRLIPKQRQLQTRIDPPARIGL